MIEPDFHASHFNQDYGTKEHFIVVSTSVPPLPQPQMEFSLSRDQKSYVISQFLALVLSRFYFRWLKPKNADLNALISALIGIGLTYLCFGDHIVHLFIQILIFELVTRSAPNHPSFVLFALLIHLSYVHIRLMQLSSGYVYSISGPIMISTQKLSHLAFAIKDNQTPQDKLTTDQKLQAVQKPNFKRLLGYVFAFHGVLSGPLFFYRDYLDFITLVQANNNFKVTIVKLIECVVYVASFLIITSRFPIEQNLLDDRTLSNVIRKLPLLILSLQISMFGYRSRYYFAWKLSEAVNLSSGFGVVYKMDEHGQVFDTYSVINNVNPLRVEFGKSFKEILDAWNIQTTIWLRRICYDRLKGRQGRTMATHILSAFWHGFYPGYYLAFISAALGSYAGRGCRRSFRPLFLKSPSRKRFYDVLTWFSAITAANYCLIPFSLLDFHRGYSFFMQYRFVVQLIFVFICIITPCGSKKSEFNQLEKESIDHHNKKDD